MHVHDLDGTCLPCPLRGFYRVERECHQLGTGVVRYRYVYTFFHLIPIVDKLYAAIRIQIGVCVAWPATALCIVRRLYYIASPTAVTTTRTEVCYQIKLGVTKQSLNIQPL